MKKKQLWFLTFNKDCPLDFAERLVYSHLVSKIRHGKSQFAKNIAVHTGLDRASVVAASLGVLESHGLVEKSKGCWRALQPTGATEAWFVPRKSESDKWHERLAYFPISMPNRSKLMTRCAVVYWFLVSVANNQRRQNITGIANCLSIGWATAARSVKQLQKMGLISSNLRPTKVQQDDLWREGRKRKKQQTKPAVVDNYRMSSLFKPQFSLEAFKERSIFDEHVDRIGTKMRRAGYSEDEIGEYIRETQSSFTPVLRNESMSWFLRASMETLFAQAERETEKNRMRNRFQGKNSLGMLKHLTKSFVARINKAHERFEDVQVHMFWINAA